MVNEVYFNNDFKSSSASCGFVRIMFVLNNGTMFGVMSKKDELKEQKFSFKEYVYHRHIKGVVGGCLVFKEREFFTVENFSKYTKEEIDTFQKILKKASRSFRYHIGKKYSGIEYTIAEQNEMYNKISQLKKDLMEMRESGTITFKSSSSKAIEYKEIEIEEATEATTIIDEVFKNEGSVVRVFGKHYVLKEEYGIPKIYEVLNYDGDDSSEPKEVFTEVKSCESKKVYQTKKMAFCMNDDGLFNFNKNELYEIVKNADGYLLLKDVFGKERHAKAERFEVMDVFEDVESVEGIEK